MPLRRTNVAIRCFIKKFGFQLYFGSLFLNVLVPLRAQNLCDFYVIRILTYLNVFVTLNMVALDYVFPFCSFGKVYCKCSFAIILVLSEMGIHFNDIVQSVRDGAVKLPCIIQRDMLLPHSLECTK